MHAWILRHGINSRQIIELVSLTRITTYYMDMVDSQGLDISKEGMKRPFRDAMGGVVGHSQNSQNSQDSQPRKDSFVSRPHVVYCLKTQDDFFWADYSDYSDYSDYFAYCFIGCYFPL